LFAVTQTDGLPIDPEISEAGYTAPWTVTFVTPCGSGFGISVVGQSITLTAPADGGSCDYLITGAPGNSLELTATWTAPVVGPDASSHQRQASAAGRH
jgi:hypothetical protein